MGLLNTLAIQRDKIARLPLGSLAHNGWIGEEGGANELLECKLSDFNAHTNREQGKSPLPTHNLTSYLHQFI